MVEPGVAAGGLRPGLLGEHHQVGAAGAHRRRVHVAVVDPQAEGVLVEADGAVEVGDGEVHRAGMRGGREGRVGRAGVVSSEVMSHGW